MVEGDEECQHIAIMLSRVLTNIAFLALLADTTKVNGKPTEGEALS